jgi:hydroxymethylpyrimidine/phosphomethylpyrimidine kinase
MIVTVLSVGTTHPLNLAGLGLDLRVAAALGVRPLTVVAGVSAQSAGRVLARRELDAATIAAQFAALRDEPIAAVHVGALIGPASVAAVARELAAFAHVPIVCDPVLAASGGDRLADDATIAALRATRFARASLITPNLPEAAELLGRAVADEAMDDAARDLLACGVPAVLLKGGHRAGETLDVLATAAGIERFSAPRIAGSLRGTGDLLAFAIAAELARGAALSAAIVAARSFVRARIAAGQVGISQAEKA